MTSTIGHHSETERTAISREAMTAALADRPADAAPVVGVAIWAKLPARLSDWYSAVLGLRFDERRHEDGRWHFVAAEAGKVHFEIKGESTPDGYEAPDLPRKSARCGISVTETSFEVPDVDAAMMRGSELGGEVLIEAEDHSWGRFGSLLDPERNRVGLYAGKGA